VLLHKTSDDQLLVRQSPQWQEIKQEFFSNL